MPALRNIQTDEEGLGILREFLGLRLDMGVAAEDLTLTVVTENARPNISVLDGLGVKIVTKGKQSTPSQNIGSGVFGFVE